MTGQCRNCLHWKPYWTGKEWGVKSFIDAPEAERQRILLALRDRAEIFSLSGVPGSDAVPGRKNPETLKETLGENWPEWGECELTELEREGETLARAMDGSRYMAVLCCHGNFGCVQFKCRGGERVP